VFSGVYNALSGMGVQHARLNVLANNLANVSSSGYKSDQVVQKTFGEALIEARGAYINRKNIIGATNMGCVISRTVTDHSQGQFVKTGALTDLALDGTGYYVVQKGDKRLYMRNSSFSINHEGNIVTSTGDYLLDESGKPIYVGDGEFMVSYDGTVYINGEKRTQIMLVDFESSNVLQKQGHLYFASNSNPTKALGTKIRQGFIERANVDVAYEVTNMLSAARSYETSQKILKAHDELTEKAINQVGVLR